MEAGADEAGPSKPSQQAQKGQEANQGATWGRKHSRGGIGNVWLEVFGTKPEGTGGTWLHMDALQGWVDT